MEASAAVINGLLHYLHSMIPYRSHCPTSRQVPVPTWKSWSPSPSRFYPKNPRPRPAFTQSPSTFNLIMLSMWHALLFTRDSIARDVPRLIFTIDGACVSLGRSGWTACHPWICQEKCLSVFMKSFKLDHLYLHLPVNLEYTPPKYGL